MWGCGDNNYGQLGLKESGKIAQFTRILFPEAIKDVAVGCEHTIVLTESGRVYSTGRGSKGQLGFGPVVQLLNQFTEICLQGQVKQIVCGVWFILAILEDGRVFGWGSNRCRCLVDSDESAIWEPIHLPQLVNVKKIAAGHRHIVVLLNDGSVCSFGDDRFGQLVSNAGPILDVFAGWNHTVLLKNNREVLLFGTNTFNQIAHPDVAANSNTLKFESDILDLAVGSDHVLCLVQGSGLYSFGWNEHGVLGDGTNETVHGSISTVLFDVSQIKSVFCGYGSCFLLTNNKDSD